MLSACVFPQWVPVRWTQISHAQVVLYGVYAHWKAARVAKGPPSNMIFGHLPQVQKQGRDLYLVAHDFIPRYGKVFPIWIAQRCLIWVSGPC